MKILKRLFILVAIIIAVPLIVALFARKDYAVERAVVINQPVEEVFDHVRYLRNQDRFSKWGNMDPVMIQTYRGEDGSVGAVSAWESQDRNVGKGEQEITGITPNQRIEYELRFLEPFRSVSYAYMTTEPVSEDATLLKWGFNGRMSYPVNLMLIIMDFEESIGNDLEEGLDNLKAMLE